MRSERFISEADSVLAHEGAKEEAAGDGEEEAGDGGAPEEDTFRPDRCNVAFGSAHDGWAFRLDQFAGMYADKLGCRCERVMGPFCLDFTRARLRTRPSLVVSLSYVGPGKVGKELW